MKPIMQTKFNEDGNCWQAAVASLLEIPLEAVPDFSNKANPNRQTDWFTHFSHWLFDEFSMFVWIYNPEREIPAFHILAGESPRGFSHAVVARKDEIIHDPHPEGGGLVKLEERYLFFPLSPRVHQQGFYDLIRADEEMTEEQKQSWLSQEPAP